MTRHAGAPTRVLLSTAALALAALPPSIVLADLPGSRNAKVTQVYEHALPDVPGKSIRGVLVEYGPGGYSPSHTHAKSALIYATVLEGAVRSQINGGPVRTFQAGEHFTELPGDHHNISANASDSQPAKLLAVFVVDTAETELTTPDRQ
ncbi:cupin domain-containing protein [Azospirillum rugosum]|uniref:Quercetin dioxygenase-like cupin family protein n=1 Tax=Azospirillum rugosum TaxID=416170 RepID=A0ABS4SMU8_9PROT|nr:cupin domain-containing protein [Azospirillum rugosum]MBP2293408.1 quercetin dioxygenase-like cupin family protein [Azospirillum rugosum]